MNQIFSFKRYVWLLKRQWYENAAGYKWGIILMALSAGLLFFLYGDWKPVAHRSIIPHIDQNHVFFFTEIVFIFVFCSFFFENLTSRYKRMFYFSLPVSSLERIAATFTCVLAFIPLQLAVFAVCDMIAVRLFNHIHGTSIQMFFKTVMSFEGTDYLFHSLFCLSLISMYLLGSLLFGKKGRIIVIMVAIFFSIPCVVPVKNVETKIIGVNPSENEVSETFFKNYLSVIGVNTTWFVRHYMNDEKTGKIIARIDLANTKNLIASAEANITMSDLTAIGYGYYFSPEFSEFSLSSIETVVSSDITVHRNGEPKISSRKFLGLIFKIMYSLSVPVLWILMYFVMKRKEA